jgi:hypothetical protein
LPDASTASHLLEGLGIEGVENRRDHVKNVGADHRLAGELSSTIRSGEKVPGRIAVNESMLGIENVTDCCASFECLHDAKQATAHFPYQLAADFPSPTLIEIV